jgi:cell division protease FtsH
MYRQARQGSMQAFSFGKTKARLAGMNPSDKDITFKDVAGLIEAKEEVSEVVEFLKDPKKFHKLGARIPRGILLVGAPGTGKTLLAKAVANEASVPFFYVSGSEFVEMFVGVGANRVRDTFETAKRAAPAIVFVDEIDAVGRQRGAGIGGGHDEREQTLNQILVEMDGFDTNDAVIVMAATNRPDILDPALLRPGRFDRRIILDEPSLEDRIAVLTIHAKEKPIAKDVNMRIVAERTPGFSGADLANLVNEAAILAARKGQRTISQQNLLESIEKVMLGPERRSHVLSTKEKEVTAYHEAGHAIVAASLPGSDPVHKVSIISRGRAGGYTLKLPSQDKYLKSKSEFEAELAVLLAGHTTEEVIFDELTTGASNDLRVASDLARRMVTQYGMSEKLGPLSYGETHESIFLGRELMHDRNYSEHVAQLIDAEVLALIERAKATARDIIEKNMDALRKVAGHLIEKETIEQREFYELIGQPVPAQSGA